MANTSRPNGFTVHGGLTGSPYNGKATLYYVASAADEILAGDVLKHGGTSDANGIPTADLCGATDVPIGIVVGVMHSKFDPAGKLTTGSTALDLPAAAQIAASGAGYVLVNDDPNVLLEAETSNGSIALTEIGQNVSHANGTRDATTVSSPATIDAGTNATTSTLNFNLRGFVRRVDNEVATTASRVLVAFNRHQYKSVGTTGI